VYKEVQHSLCQHHVPLFYRRNRGQVVHQSFYRIRVGITHVEEAVGFAAAAGSKTSGPSVP